MGLMGRACGWAIWNWRVSILLARAKQAQRRKIGGMQPPTIPVIIMLVRLLPVCR